MSKRIAITHAVRTPIGKYLGSLSGITAPALGTMCVEGLLAESGIDPTLVNELFFGEGRQAGSGPNPGRQVAINAGLSQEAPAWTINQACASGLRSIVLAAQSIQLGENDIAIAGGVESMSNMPFMIENMRMGLRMGHKKLVDAMYKDGFVCPLSGDVMGKTAETLAVQHSITRLEQDEFALASQHKAEAAEKAGYFDAERLTLELKDRKGNVTPFDTDEHRRDGMTIEKVGKLKPVFDAENGTVTAGNSSGITDGASALLLMSEEKAQELGYTPLAFFEDWAQAGVDPSIMGIGPVPALKKLEAKTGRATADYDLLELNEAFAAQVIACHRELPLPMDRVNVNGGAIALGHPIGATGARIVVTMLHEMARRDVKTGVASLCVSGGMGVAASFVR